ncbi:ABC transporter ATP-binding protein [Acetanaerobacterium elongatum]|uniref:Energy-coupling factor transport system ATP-binding protein n=1 Tax=Acetanaerobacterium elongatum TaxID=258515 RepID=A0A1G9XXI9_9FIRM|nr:ABC transporter ATP-binding protein [Acetanaerobacterium elongatum]SDN01542.1 energy-coupling factor transport system ATP-binding protein [Acetanaerobacterium elongatum]
MEILRLDSFSFRYPHTQRCALKDITLSADEGDFVLLCGASGSGKSTLLENLKPELRRNGERTGEITCLGRPLQSLSRMESACDIGFVMQNLEAQLVADTVRGELCFGLESLGFPPEVIRRRVAEMASYFGLGKLLNRSVNTLSGGEKQLVSLASVLSLSPKLLLLDEPASQLDPVAARELFSMLARINSELGITILLAEHHTEELFTLCSKAVLLHNGQVSFCGAPREAARFITQNRTLSSDAIPPQTKESGSAYVFTSLLPSAAKIFPDEPSLPLSVREGRALFKQKISGRTPPAPMPVIPPTAPPAVSVTDVYFGYGSKDTLLFHDLSLTLYEGELSAVMGANGSGKSTLLKLLCGLLKPKRGTIELFGKRGAKPTLGYLPQNPRLLFLADTVQQDLTACAENLRLLHPEERIQSLSEALGISDILSSHPYDISAGELQRAALAKVLLSSPRLLLLDEPTKALDPFAKSKLAALLRGLVQSGVTVLFASHDTEFCASYCDRCALLFDGQTAATGAPAQFFGGNVFYSTAAARIAAGFSYDSVTCGEVRNLWIK